MSDGRLSAATAPPGLLAKYACAFINGSGSTAATVHDEDASSRLAPAQELIEIVMPVRRGYNPVTHQLSGGFGALEVVNSTAGPQEVRIRSVIKSGPWSGRLVQVLDADAGTGSCPLPSMLERFTVTLYSYAHHLSPERTRALTLQLRSLLAIEEEFHEASIYPSTASFKGLVELLRLNPSFKHPNLSIDSKGHFVASWAPHRRAKLSLTFAGVNGGTWVAADRSPGVKERASGTFSVSEIGGILDPFTSWMSA